MSRSLSIHLSMSSEFTTWDRALALVAAGGRPGRPDRPGGSPGRTPVRPAPARGPEFVADPTGDPRFARDADGRRRWKALLENTHAAFGLPGDSPEGLATLVGLAKQLRWVHGTAAGLGEQIRRAELDPQVLESVIFSSSGGVHAVPLAEWGRLSGDAVTTSTGRSGSGSRWQRRSHGGAAALQPPRRHRWPKHSPCSRHPACRR
jgi:hypothetical protein